MKKILILIMSLLSFTWAGAQNTIKVSVHNVVEAGEQFNVTFSIEGNLKAGDLEWAPAAGFELLWGPQYGHSSSTSFINGKRTSSSESTFTYVLRCDNPGKYVIPSATARHKGQTYKSEPVEIEVVSGGGSGNVAADQQQSQNSTGKLSTDDLFMQFELDRSRVVVGEPIHATLKLYLRVDIVGLEGFTPPTFNGFWTKETKSPTTLEFAREKYKDQIWSVATIREYVLIPQQSGNLSISPAELICLVNVRDDSFGNSAMDLFFNSGYKTINKKLKTSPVTVKVSPLPQPAPLSSTGGVGKFSISAKLQADSLNVNDASSLIVKVKGSGNISLIGQPIVNFPPDFESYDVKISERLDASGLRGEKTYEFPFIPRSAGDFEIPSINFSYYDIQKKQYETSTTGPLPIHVAKVAGAQGDVQGSGPDVVKSFDQKEVGNLNRDIRYISRDHRRFEPHGTFFLGTPLFWGLFFLMTLGSLLFGLIWTKLAARRADVVKTRTRKASKMAMRRLKDAKKYLDQHIQGAFYEELHKALLGFVADKMNVPYGQLSQERIAELLVRHGVPQADADEFVNLLDAPSTGNKDMDAHYAAALEVISKLDSNIKTMNNSPMKNTLAVLLLLCVPFLSQGMDRDEAENLWATGNAAYNEGQWNRAVEAYSQIETAGLEAPELYYNMANAYYKSGEIPMSILYWNRALRLDPSMKDAAYNLEMAQGQIKDKIDEVPEFILKTWMRDFCYSIGSDTWTILFLVFLALALVMALLYFLSRNTPARQAGFFTGLIALVVAILCISMASWQKNNYTGDEAAVVMTPVVSVKSSPSEDNSTELFLLHEGTTIEVLQHDGDWYEIKLADGRRGWLLTREVMDI